MSIISITNLRLQFPEGLGLLGLLGLVGVIGYVTELSVLRPGISAFAGFSLIGLRFFRERNLHFPAKLGLLCFIGFLGFLGFIPGVEFFKSLFGFFGFGFFFAFLGSSQTPSQ